MSRKDKMRKVMKDCGITDKQTAEQVLQARNIMYNTGISINNAAVKKAVDAKADEIKSEVISMILADNIVTILNVLHVKFGFGAKRMRDFMTAYFNYSECMTDPMRFGVETPDICKAIKEETGFDIAQEIMDFDRREQMEEKHNQAMFNAFTSLGHKNLQIRHAIEFCMIDGKKVARETWENDGKKPAFLIQNKKGIIVDDCADEYHFSVNDIAADDWMVVE